MAQRRGTAAARQRRVASSIGLAAAAGEGPRQRRRSHHLGHLVNWGCGSGRVVDHRARFTAALSVHAASASASDGNGAMEKISRWARRHAPEEPGHTTCNPVIRCCKPPVPHARFAHPRQRRAARRREFRERRKARTGSRRSGPDGHRTTPCGSAAGAVVLAHWIPCAGAAPEPIRAPQASVVVGCLSCCHAGPSARGGRAMQQQQRQRQQGGAPPGGAAGGAARADGGVGAVARRRGARGRPRPRARLRRGQQRGRVRGGGVAAAPLLPGGRRAAPAPRHTAGLPRRRAAALALPAASCGAGARRDRDHGARGGSSRTISWT